MANGSDSGDEVAKARARLLEVYKACRQDRFRYFPSFAREFSHEARESGLVVFSTGGSSFAPQLARIEDIAGRNGLRIAAIVDDTEARIANSEHAYAGYPLLGVDRFFEQAARFKGCTVVDRSCTWYPGIRYKVRLKQAGFPVLRLEQFLNAPALDSGGGYYRSHSDFMLEHFEKFLALESLWADDKSLSTYYCALSSFISMNYQNFSFYCGDHRERYFPGDIDFQFGHDEVYLDCGSFDGYEAIFFSEKVEHRFGAIHAFEPDRRNYARLCTAINRYIVDKRIENIFCHQLGVYDRSAFLACEGEGTTVTLTDTAASGGENGLHVGRLDDLVDEVTHLRLEVEGAEVAALRGASRLLEKFKPSMVVSAYHKPSDFLDIAAFLQESQLDYELRVRQQSLEPGVLCVYCT